MALVYTFVLLDRVEKVLHQQLGKLPHSFIYRRCVKFDALAGLNHALYHPEQLRTYAYKTDRKQYTQH